MTPTTGTCTLSRVLALGVGMKTVEVAGLAVPLILSLGACQGTAEGETAGAGASDDVSQVSSAEVPLVLAESACDSVQRCGLAAANPQAPYANYDFCVELVEVGLGDRMMHFAEGLSQGDLWISDEGLRACLARHESCEESFPVCEGYLGGGQPLGTPCITHWECGADGYCALDDQCRGTCTRGNPAGERCGTAFGHCARDLHCGPDKVCQRGLRAGEECTKGSVCEPGTDCLAALEAGTGVTRCRTTNEVLKPSAGEGEICGTAEGLCTPPLVCVAKPTEAGVCRPRFAADGPCERAVPDGCPLSQYCDPVEGRCLDRGEHLAPCTFEQLCAAGLVCRDGLCRVAQAKPVGEECEGREECASGICLEGSCALGPNCSFFPVPWNP